MQSVIIDCHEPPELDILLKEIGITPLRKRLVPGDILVKDIFTKEEIISKKDK